MADYLFDGEETIATLVCGVDEAGRGPLAGPVVAAAVILNPDHPIEGLRDSKKLTAHAREVLCRAELKRMRSLGRSPKVRLRTLTE